MEQSLNTKIAELEVNIKYLQRQERRLRGILASSQASPKGKEEANDYLVALETRIAMAELELKRLESGQ